MRIILKAVNQELAARGTRPELQTGDGYFYFHMGEAANWLDRTVRLPTLNSLTLSQWLDEFQRLKKLNAEIMARKPKRTKKAHE
jgi:hypothetical protein